jgi:hypothetical protein
MLIAAGAGPLTGSDEITLSFQLPGTQQIDGATGE